MSRRRRLIRTFVPLAIACSVPLSMIWVLSPLIRDSAALRREVQMTNPLIDAPPRGYGDPEPVVVGVESSLTMLHRYDFSNRRESSDERTDWEETVRNNLEWIDTSRYDVLRIGVGDAATSLATEATEWDWLLRPTQSESRVELYCKTTAFAAPETVKDTLQTLPWKGIITGEYSRAVTDDLAAACAKENVELYAGFSNYFGPNNDFMVGFAWDQSAQTGKHLIDARAVSNAAPGAVRNLLFLLTMQFRPEGVFTHLSTNEHAYAWTMNTNTQDLRNWYTYLRGQAGDRPVANVLFDEEKLAADSALAHYQRHFLATILSGIGLAGYDVAITKGDPIVDADLHVVLSEDGALSDAAKSLVRADGPLLWFPVRGVGFQERTTPIAEEFGLRSDAAVSDAGPSPERIEVDGAFVRWQTENGQDRNPSYVGLAADAVDGEVLMADGDTPVVIRDGKHAVFNGAALHPEAAYIIARTISALTGREIALGAPFNGYAVVGTRSAFFANGATELRVHLHDNDGVPFEIGKPIRVVRFNTYGNLLGREVIDYKAPFSEVMTAHELIIVEAVPS